MRLLIWSRTYCGIGVDPLASFAPHAAWAVLQPLATMIVFSLVLGRVAGDRTNQRTLADALRPADHERLALGPRDALPIAADGRHLLRSVEDPRGAPVRREDLSLREAPAGTRWDLLRQRRGLPDLLRQAPAPPSGLGVTTQSRPAGR